MGEHPGLLPPSPPLGGSVTTWAILLEIRSVKGTISSLLGFGL